MRSMYRSHTVTRTLYIIVATLRGLLEFGVPLRFWISNGTVHTVSLYHLRSVISHAYGRSARTFVRLPGQAIPQGVGQQRHELQHELQR